MSLRCIHNDVCLHVGGSIEVAPTSLISLMARASVPGMSEGPRFLLMETTQWYVDAECVYYVY